ncbi:MAG: TIGR02996 domain-containing protein [Gemmataceae bacterium]|nr:TIGR02996 domain-containing protein [Gemmata sp.]MDW8198422.1 TIGR02996 domain-containing protein [Gemmataceae bacterium]
MNEGEALRAAICEYPDEDAPRLIYADYLEEHGATARAAFIRAQVELARLPPWEPRVVDCRWHQPELLSGIAFRDELPPSQARSIAWGTQPFRRGFGWNLEVRSVGLWTDYAEPLFRQEPIGQIDFWGGLLDDWRKLAASPTVQQFRDIAFHTNPIEPLWALRDQPTASGITDLRFYRASGAGMPVVIEELFQSLLGRSIRGLHFHTGYESVSNLIDAINTAESLERLTFVNMGITEDHMRQLLEGPPIAGLQQLVLRNDYGYHTLQAVAERSPIGLEDLTLANLRIRPWEWGYLAQSERLTNLRRIDATHSVLTPLGAEMLASSSLRNLRMLHLCGCNICDEGVRHLTQAMFWPHLVELDLRQNNLSPNCLRYLLDAPLPPHLTALVLDREWVDRKNRRLLTQKYGRAVIFVNRSVPE